MKTLIIGRTGTGKDTLRLILEQNYNWKFVISYTTRPKRTKDEKSHIFITKEEAKNFKDEDKAAKTVIGDIEYFATKQQIEECDGYIIDPKGLEYMVQSMPDTLFEVVYLDPVDADTQKAMAIARGDNPQKELERYQKRAEDENDQFTGFEKKLENGELRYPNCSAFLRQVNDYKESTLTNLAIQMECRRRFYMNLVPIIDTMAENGFVRTADNGQIKVAVTGEDGKETIKTVTKEKFAQMLSCNTTEFAEFMKLWLMLPGDAK